MVGAYRGDPALLERETVFSSRKSRIGRGRPGTQEREGKDSTSIERRSKNKEKHPAALRGEALGHVRKDTFVYAEKEGRGGATR